QLRVAEHERIALVDERDVDVVGDFMREPGRDLEPAEAGAEDHHPQPGHQARISFWRLSSAPCAIGAAMACSGMPNASISVSACGRSDAHSPFTWAMTAFARCPVSLP